MWAVAMPCNLPGAARLCTAPLRLAGLWRVVLPSTSCAACLAWHCDAAAANPVPPGCRCLPQVTILVPNNKAWFDLMFKNGAACLLSMLPITGGAVLLLLTCPAAARGAERLSGPAVLAISLPARLRLRQIGQTGPRVGCCKPYCNTTRLCVPAAYISRTCRLLPAPDQRPGPHADGADDVPHPAPAPQPRPSEAGG